MKDIGFHERGAVVKVDFGSVETRTRVEKNYDELINKPSIEGIILEGDTLLSDLNAATLLYHTEAEWDAQQALKSARGVIYIYSDHTKIVNPSGEITIIPAIKIGDGVSYLSDLPFIGGGASPEVEQELHAVETVVNQHVADDEAHVSEEDREEWGRKVSARMDEDNPEMLIIY